MSKTRPTKSSFNKSWAARGLLPPLGGVGILRRRSRRPAADPFPLEGGLTSIPPSLPLIQKLLHLGVAATPQVLELRVELRTQTGELRPVERAQRDFEEEVCRASEGRHPLPESIFCLGLDRFCRRCHRVN